MTDSKKKTDLDTFLIFFSSLFALLLLLCFPREVGAGVRDGLLLCYRAIIPAVFPFAILAELLLAIDLTPIDKTLGRLIGLPFGFSPIGGRTLLFGILFGFPLGAKMSAELYSENRIGKNEAERLIIAASLPSPAFLISGVGASMLGDTRIGTYFMILVLASGLGVTLLLPRRRSESPILHTAASSRRFSLTDAITSAAWSTLTVTATVTFFSVLSALVIHLIPLRPLAVCFSAILELGSGASNATKLIRSGKRLGWVLLGGAASFSGLSVYLQVRAAVRESGLKTKAYLPAKLVSGVFTAIISFYIFG